MTTFAVVTEVPPPTSIGNMATALGQIMVSDPTDPTADLTSLDDKLTIPGSLPQTLWWRLPVFTLGEILILDSPSGREVDGIGRKPSKWDIAYVTFDTIDEAITRAREIADRVIVDDLDGATTASREEPSDA